MKKIYIFLLSILLSGMAYAEDFPKLLTDFEKIKLETGQTRQLPPTLPYVESDANDTVDVSVTWTVAPDTLGSIDASLLFTAEKPGEGELKASYDTIHISVELEIEEEEYDDSDEDNDFPKLLTTIKEIELYTGEIFQLPAMLDYVESAVSDTIKVDVVWTAAPDTLGSIDEFAVFRAEKPGEGYLYATYDTISISVELEVEEEEYDDSDEDNDFPKLLTTIKEIELYTGEIFQLPAMLDYVESVVSDTIKVDVVWTADPDTLGSIDEFAVFKAEKPGEGYLHATYDTISISVELEVEIDDDDKDDDLDDDYPKVKIVPGSVKVELGDSLELYAFYIDPNGVKTDTTFFWSVEPAELGTFPAPEVPVFKTDAIGKGIIIAQLDGLADTTKLEVYESKWKKEKNNNGKNGKQLTITPGDTMVFADAGIIQYEATYKTNGNKHNNAELAWSVNDTSIATIDPGEGTLVLKGKTGITLVSAEYSNFKASVELIVIDPSVDPVVNSITIHRVLPNGKALNPKTFKEGESYKIGGLPYPLNILNAGMLHFPFGCISEDITIFMTIPEEYASMGEGETEVTFSDEIITGVEFNVQPESSDTTVHPYWFDVPVELKLVFKRGLIDSLGIAPTDLDVFFAENTLFTSVGEGVAMVDSAQNRIYASIEHFSTIVVRQKEAQTAVNPMAPVSGNLLDIYPNPFNTSTTIQLHLEETANAKVEIFNIFGQKVQELADSELREGVHRLTWEGDDSKGTPATSGIYLCRFMLDGKVAQIKKLILNR